VRYVTDSTLAKLAIKFPRDGHRTVRNWNKPDCKDGNDQMALSRNYLKRHDIINKPPLHDAYTATFVEQLKFSFSEYL